MSNEKNYGYPVGFYNDLHPNFSINFTMNRFYNWTNDPDMLTEMRQAAPTIHTYEEYIKAFLSLGEKALEEGRKLKAAFYLRGAEFYIPESNPMKQAIRKQFLALIKECYGVNESYHYAIPYEGGALSAYRFSPNVAKGTILCFGGYDSYIEELFKFCIAFRDAGYDFICFDGPGQGIVLEDERIPLTHEWEKPVKAVLDFFNLDDVTMLGMSMGGYFVIRAAAFEKRVKRVIADDVFADFYSILLNGIGTDFSGKIDSLMASKDAENVNSILKMLAEKNLMLQWALTQGMHITGAKTPYEFIQNTKLYNTAEISSLVTQDVLLLAAQEDHYIPISQLFEQEKTLINVQSLTSRIFTRKEHAQNHCQCGNIGLSIDVMLNWIQETQKHTNNNK